MAYNAESTITYSSGGTLYIPIWSYIVTFGMWVMKLATN
jgi:hypothetical protein